MKKKNLLKYEKKTLNRVKKIGEKFFKLKKKREKL